MKKILSITLYSISVIILLVSFYILGESYFQNTFFDNSIELNVSNISPDIKDSEVTLKIEELSNKYNINISRHIYTSKDNLSIYTTDTTFLGKINLNQDSDNKKWLINFYANDTEKEKFVIFSYPNKNKHIKIFPIDEVKKYGFVGNYIINVNGNERENIINGFNNIFGEKNVSVYIDTVDRGIDFFKLYDANEGIALPLFLVILICVIIILLTLIKIVLNKSKDIALLLIHGFSYMRITKIIVVYLMSPIIISLACATITITLFMHLFSDIVYITNMFIVELLIYIIYMIAIMLVVYICTIIVCKRHNKNELLKKKKIFKSFSYLQTFFKCVLITAVMLLLLNILETDNVLKEMQKRDQYWKQAENIYKIKRKFTVGSSDLAAVRPYEIKSKNLYIDLVENKNVFLLDTRAYYLSENNKYLWEDEADAYPYYAKSIKVNTNYLQKHLIYSLDNKKVQNQIIENEYTWNILVPEYLKANEVAIKKEFLDVFEFYKIKIPQMYHNETGEKLSDISKQQLDINIIYIGKQNYFTYNSDVAIMDNNVINDNPIVIVDTMNLDSSVYYAWLSNSVFFKSVDVDPLSNILTISQKYDLLSSYRTIESVFDERAEAIQKIEKKLFFNFTILLFAISLLAVVIFMINTTYLEINNKKIFIKHTFGFSIFNILKYKLMFDILLYVMILSIFFVPIIYKLLLVVFDIFVNVLCLKIMYNKSINNILKGGL